MAGRGPNSPTTWMGSWPLGGSLRRCVPCGWPAPGRSGTFTSEYSIAKRDGKDIVFTVSRMDEAWLEDASFLGEDPHRTGAIKYQPTASDLHHRMLTSEANARPGDVCIQWPLGCSE
jgi:hypothetical protein